MNILPDRTGKHFDSAKSHRHYIITKWLLSLPSEASILDAGAGVMRYKNFCQHLNYTSQDFGEYKGESRASDDAWDSTKCDVICDINDIPLKSNSFNYILCSEVFEHLPRPDSALKELARLLKPEGSLLITCPFASSYHQEPYFFSAGYSKYWFEEFASHYSLKITELIEYGDFFSAMYSMFSRFSRVKEVDSVFLDSMKSFARLVQANRNQLDSIVHHQPESLTVLMTKAS